MTAQVWGLRPRLPKARRAYAVDSPELFWAGTNEAQLQERLRRFCKALGLLHYHTHNSQRSEGGFPDSLIARTPGEWQKPWLVLLELKAEKGRLSPAQRVWRLVLEGIEGASDGVIVYREVRPSTWKSTETLLTDGRLVGGQHGA